MENVNVGYQKLLVGGLIFYLRKRSVFYNLYNLCVLKIKSSCLAVICIISNWFINERGFQMKLDFLKW